MSRGKCLGEGANLESPDPVYFEVTNEHPFSFLCDY